MMHNVGKKKMDLHNNIFFSAFIVQSWVLLCFLNYKIIQIKHKRKEISNCN